MRRSRMRSKEMTSSSSGLQPVAPIPAWIEKLIDRAVQMLQNETLRQKIQIQLIEPLLTYMLERLFPYLVILCVVFGLMILSSASILVLLVMKPTAAAVATAIAPS